MRQQTLLHVDLTTGKVETELVPREVERQFIGGRGINAYYAYKNIKPGIDPLGPENTMVFGTGFLTGTTAPCSGRVAVTCKSPATNLYVKSSSGGHWGSELKFAGFDYLMITGSSPKPVYLWIDDGKVEIRDAQALWGADTRESNRLIKQDLGDHNIEVATIGPAGENKCVAACINMSYHSAAGRAGTGAVMGSKNLKAIAVRGTGSVGTDNPEAFYGVTQRVRQELAADSGTQGLYLYGTAGFLPGVAATYALNNRNFQNNYIEYADKISGQHLVEAGYLTGRLGCNACAINCHRYVKNHSGAFAGIEGTGPEFEAMISLGSGTDVSDTGAIIKANDLCNRMGLDVISGGNFVQFAMECYERGYLSDDLVEGMDLTWGSGQAMCDLIERIAYRDSKLGDLLAKGTKRAAEELGGDAWKSAVQAKGLEQSCVETRSSMSYALAFAVNPRGPDHLMTECIAEYGATAEAVRTIGEITGDESMANPWTIEKRDEIVRWHEDCYALTEVLGMCVFTSTLAYAVNPTNLTEMYNVANGSNLSVAEAMEVGRRIVTVEKAFNVREGARREHDVLPYRIMNEGVAQGPRAGCMNNPEEMNIMLDQYYALHGWDLKTSIPKPETLDKLGLSELLADMPQPE